MAARIPVAQQTERNAIIIKRFKAGVAIKAIAYEVGIHPSYVGQRLVAFGLKNEPAIKPGWPQGLSIAGLSNREAALLLEPYVTASHAGKVLGISRGAVIGYWWRARNGSGRTLAENQSRAAAA